PPHAALAAHPSGVGATARATETANLAGTTPVLTGGAAGHATGELPGATTVYVGADRSGAWRLRVAGRQVPAETAFGWAQRFSVPPGGGPAVLQTSAGVAEHVGMGVELLLWAVALALVSADLRRRRLRPPGSEAVRPEWFAPLDGGGPPRSHRSGRDVIGSGDEAMDSDEVWIDG
ncbi:MAG: hypothetical protein ACYC1D_10925, partial [Acidimicrobiales bacterium]